MKCYCGIRKTRPDIYYYILYTYVKNLGVEISDVIAVIKRLQLCKNIIIYHNLSFCDDNDPRDFQKYGAISVISQYYDYFCVSFVVILEHIFVVFSTTGTYENNFDLKPISRQIDPTDEQAQLIIWSSFVLFYSIIM